ncbi:hypothetical protein MVEN_01395400 [Mycena venus]|uniref:Uncharacterized protein n=1 Tax=Mycena venus TaxID=2733690 RepID=A0A8H7CSN0_9AGAR|nr:hypothetical protein MVEN_01395400 [Mycena venus]
MPVSCPRMPRRPGFSSTLLHSCTSPSSTDSPASVPSSVSSSTSSTRTAAGTKWVRVDGGGGWRGAPTSSPRALISSSTMAMRALLHYLVDRAESEWGV